MYITYWIVNFFRYLMTAGTFCSLPIGIPVTVSTMKNLVVNSFLSFVLSLFCSLEDGGNLRRFFSIWSHPQTNVRNHFPPVFDFFKICRPWMIAILFFTFHFGMHFTLYELESVCQSQIFYGPKVVKFHTFKKCKIEGSDLVHFYEDYSGQCCGASRKSPYTMKVYANE